MLVWHKPHGEAPGRAFSWMVSRSPVSWQAVHEAFAGEVRWVEGSRLTVGSRNDVAASWQFSQVCP